MSSAVGVIGVRELWHVVSPEDVKRMGELSRSRIDALTMEDNALFEASLAEFRGWLHELEAKYGPHPKFFEYRADTYDDPDESEPLYRMALALAEKHGLESLSIRLALAELLLEDRNDPESALLVMEAPSGEFDGDEFNEKQTAEWRLLVERVRNKLT